MLDHSHSARDSTPAHLSIGEFADAIYLSLCFRAENLQSHMSQRYGRNEKSERNHSMKPRRRERTILFEPQRGQMDWDFILFCSSYFKRRWDSRCV